MKEFTTKELKEHVEEAEKRGCDFISFDGTGMISYCHRLENLKLPNVLRKLYTPLFDKLEYSGEYIYDDDLICGVHYVVVECEVVGYGLFCDSSDEGDTYIGVELKPISDVPEWVEDVNWEYDFGEVDYAEIQRNQMWLGRRYHQWEVFKKDKKQKA